MKLRNRRAMAVALAVIVTASSVTAQTTPPPAPPALQPPTVQVQPPPVVQPPAVTPPPVAAPTPAAPATGAPAKAATKKAAPKKSDGKTAKSSKKAAPAKKEPAGPAVAATVKQSRVNLRGQPSLSGEVITQVNKGEKVTILEEIPGKKGKPGEPTVWARIAMPTNTPVWVSAVYVDTAASTVKSKKLNLRAGPGENFSVVGELKQGAAIKQIRQNDNWIEIEAPANAYAFVALDLLEKGEALAASAKSTKPAKTSPEKTGKATLVASAPLTTTEVKVDDAPVAPGTKTAKMETLTPAEPVKPRTEPAVVVSDSAPAPVVVPKAPKRRFYESAAGPRRGNSMETDRPLYQTIGQFDPNAPPVRRNVRREGIINSTMFYSVQTPTYYQLVGEDSGEVLDFLYPSDPSMKLSAMTGARVIVTGEEYLDPRWPKTPVLKIDTLEVAPDAAR